MSRLDQAALIAAAAEMFNGSPDPDGVVDLISDEGSIIVAAQATDFKKAFKRLRKVEGYRWLVLNREDLFLANNMSVGSKAGIKDQHGNTLKAAALPR